MPGEGAKPEELSSREMPEVCGRGSTRSCRPVLRPEPTRLALVLVPVVVMVA